MTDWWSEGLKARRGLMRAVADDMESGALWEQANV